MVKNGYSKYHIHRRIRQWQLVRRSHDETRIPAAAAYLQSPSGQSDQIFGDVQRAHIGAACHKAYGIRTRPTPELEHLSSTDVTQEVISELKWIRCRRRRAFVAGLRPFAYAQCRGRCAFRLNGTAGDLRALPLFHSHTSRKRGPPLGGQLKPATEWDHGEQHLLDGIVREAVGAVSVDATRQPEDPHRASRFGVRGSSSRLFGLCGRSGRRAFGKPPPTATANATTPAGTTADHQRRPQDDNDHAAQECGENRVARPAREPPQPAGDDQGCWA